MKIAGAALNETALSINDRQLMLQYAKKTSSSYCAGCAELCAEAIANTIPICDIMRYLMYYSSYGDQAQAIQLVNELAEKTRKQLARVDYSKAEQSCSQRMPIAHLMKKARRLYLT